MDDRHEENTAATALEPSDELILAAARRAALHHPQSRSRAPIWLLLEHMDIARRSGTARLVRARLADLERRGLLERGTAHGVPMWALTAAGARRLRRVERAGSLPALPESPQHRAWRNARTLAGQEIERFSAELKEALTEAERLLALDRTKAVQSDVWLELSARTSRACRLLASARHCLSEWPEPNDGRSDLDTLSSPADEDLGHDRLRALRTLRTGRRNVRLWQGPEPGEP